jgi:xanthine dehydrogenase large subunit
MRNLPEVSGGSSATVKGTAGQSLRHESAHKHVSGEAVYIDDMPAPANTLHAYVGLSQIARGRLTSLNLDKVRSAPGVVDVITVDDIPGHRDIGPVFPGDPLMVDNQVEFWGQVLFAVAASSYDAARKAVRLAVVEYEEQAADLTIEQGLANNSFVRPSHAQQCGDISAALAAAPLTLSGEMQIGGQEQMYLESQASLCVPQEDGGMLVYTSTQNPSEGQKLVAEVLDIPLSLVTVEPVGR